MGYCHVYTLLAINVIYIYPIKKLTLNQLAFICEKKFFNYYYLCFFTSYKQRIHYYKLKRRKKKENVIINFKCVKKTIIF